MRFFLILKSFLSESDIETKTKCIKSKYFANSRLFDQLKVSLKGGNYVIFVFLKLQFNWFSSGSMVFGVEMFN